MTLSANQRSKDSHALGKLRNGSLHIHTAIEWEAGLQPGLLTLKEGLSYFSQICFIQFFIECMFIEPVLCAKLQAQCWQVNGKSMRSQNVSWFLPLWLRKKLVGGDHVKQIITEANGQ